MQIIYEKNGQFFDMGTREGRREILGEVKGKTILVHNEQGELISFYDNPEQMDRNASLIKSLREKYPGQPLRKACDLYQEELMLKARQEKADLLKAQQPVCKVQASSQK